MAYGLKSTQEQIADYRDASDLGVAVVHIDTCLGSFLHDHHNRDGECLFGVFVDGDSTNADVLNGLLDEMRATGDRVPDSVSWDVIKGAAKALFVDLDPAARFDSSLETPPQPEDFESDKEFYAADSEWGDAEPVQAWFVLTWDVAQDTNA